MAADRSTPARDDANPSSDDNGVLDEVSVNTTAIDFTVTSQVAVQLPAGYRDDREDDDRDVIADEIRPAGIDDGDAVAPDEAVTRDDEADVVTGEILVEDDEEDAEAAPDAGPADDDDEGDGSEVADPAPEAEEVAPEAGDAPVAEEVDDAELVDDAEPVEDAEPDAGSDDAPVDAEDDLDAMLLDALEPEAVPAVAEPEPAAPEHATAERTAPESSASEPQPEVESAPERIVVDEAPAAEEPEAVEPEPLPAEVELRGPEPVPAAVTNTTANAVVAAARVEGPKAPEKTPAARRAGEVQASAGRESADVLTADRLLDTGAIRRPEPVDPWRRIVYSATRGLVNLGDGRKTREQRELSARIASPLAGHARFVPVLSRKGGVGKTTVTALLGMALADARDDRVVAVDANPDRGTLAERIAKPSGKTVRDLVRSHDQITGFSDVSAHVVRDETRLDVLASESDPHVSEAFGDADYRGVADIAEHYYSIVLTDTGTGIVHSVMGATLDLADQLVIVAGLSVDASRLASETLTWLETNGHEQLARKAVVVLNQDKPGAPLLRLDELEAHFASRVRHVVRVPYDERLATGSTIAFHELDRKTRDAARQLAALVVEGIRNA
ncbi:MinD/ParA family ATP-binding protein [Microbacterium indicum]|uniref:MinD/ParA family ATP-binding protein n=1 Tax=Microbacterium indicum TaxID=358100 RepID=UPI0003FD5D85|nr:MinD/ParA family protein [Microbacterium indicum]